MMNGDLYRLYEQLSNDLRTFFRYDAEPAKQRVCETLMRCTMREILDTQQMSTNNNDQRSETP